MDNMILLKANTELKHTFERLIQTMDVPVTWNDIFVVLNNYLILPGEVRSLVFNFDNRKVNTNVIEIPIVEEAIQPIEENELVINTLNMILYAFGKWGTIKGIKVEKDYAQLNALFTQILKEIKIEPGYRDDNFRFYQNGVQITYEDVIQAAMEVGKKKKEEEEEEAEAEEEKLGLWHNMCWITTKASFSKNELDPIEQETERIGNNFYMVGYECPNCGKNLHMVVYPVDKEFPVETDEGKVYLARAYACDNCNRFYTPRPGKLLREGDVYLLNFEDDRNAYEDYQELLGERGEKTSNYKFNEYEWQRNKEKSQEEENTEPEEEEAEELEELTEEELVNLTEEELEELSEEKLQQLEKRLENGFYDKRKLPGGGLKLYDKVRKIRKKKINGKIGTKENEIKKQVIQKASYSPEAKAEAQKPEGPEQSKDIQEVEKVREKYNARMKVIERMSPRQLKELRENVKKEKILSEPEKQSYVEKIEQYIHKSQEKELEKRAENGRKGNYAQICRSIQEIERADYPGEMKEPILASLYELRNQKAQTEAEQLITNMPAVMDKKKYKLFREKLNQYKEADITAYEKELEDRREQAERQEIANIVNRVNKNDRGAVFRVWKRLQGPDFSRENTEKELEELYERIQKLDEAAIDRICPNIMDMTFEEGQEAYEKIANGMFLPEIKSNALEMIDKRLKKMKSDESELLVRKLQEELRGKVKDTSSLHYNSARKAMLGEWKGVEANIVKCAENTYASERSKYEYPIVVCDSTHKNTGREGFLLTPEHLFYNSTFSSESIPILQIKGISYSTGILNKGIYVHQENGEKTKIPVGLPTKDWEGFVSVMKEFITYLQEKPESRKVSYLAKEEHEVKCCYRCGYVYKGGEVCPKCGNRWNK